MSKTIGAVAAAIMLASCSAGSTTMSTSALDNACAIAAERPSYLRAMQRSERVWGVPVAVQMATIYQESKFVPNARTPRRKLFGFIPGKRISSAKGFSQAIDGTWEEYRNATGNRLASRTNISDATDFIGWYMATSQERLGISTNDARNQYLAYHEGRGGYARGSHRGKGWLLNVAGEVESRAVVYDRQLRSCGLT